MDDAQAVAVLLRRCLAGDAAAWKKLVEQHNRRIFNLCYRFTGSRDEAEDLTQEVFIKMYRTLNSYDVQRGAFTTWVTTVTRNLLVDHFRKRKMDRMPDSLDAGSGPEEEGLSLAEKLADGGVAPDRQVGRRETRELVQQALGKLSPELREAVILRDLQDMDYKEIAQALKVPEGTVKSRINRGRTELARLLQRIHKQVN